MRAITTETHDVWAIRCHDDEVKSSFVAHDASGWIFGWPTKQDADLNAPLLLAAYERKEHLPSHRRVHRCTVELARRGERVVARREMH